MDPEVTFSIRSTDAQQKNKSASKGQSCYCQTKDGFCFQRADGVAKKGKTKGKMMAGGGMAKMMKRR
jgi:hypothetical protein